MILSSLRLLSKSSQHAAMAKPINIHDVTAMICTSAPDTGFIVVPPGLSWIGFCGIVSTVEVAEP